MLFKSCAGRINNVLVQRSSQCGPVKFVEAPTAILDIWTQRAWRASSCSIAQVFCPHCPCPPVFLFFCFFVPIHIHIYLPFLVVDHVPRSFCPPSHSFRCSAHGHPSPTGTPRRRRLLDTLHRTRRLRIRRRHGRPRRDLHQHRREQLPGVLQLRGQGRRADRPGRAVHRRRVRQWMQNGRAPHQRVHNIGGWEHQWRRSLWGACCVGCGACCVGCVTCCVGRSRIQSGKEGRRCTGIRGHSRRRVCVCVRRAWRGRLRFSYGRGVNRLSAVTHLHSLLSLEHHLRSKPMCRTEPSM
ncbi:hypothetical protein B0H14DRAFT_1151162 [Mycena olivaceomarginata]|nr:hypothetical protein B0H14DRAFT_1151162 [Mycena olivaceomarginata]